MVRSEIIEELRKNVAELERQAKHDLEVAEKLKIQIQMLAGTIPLGQSNVASTNLPPQGLPNVFKKPSNRLNELAEFIKKNAPVSRKRIYEESGIPHGTLNTTLNLINFRQDADGLWILRG